MSKTTEASKQAQQAKSSLLKSGGAKEKKRFVTTSRFSRPKTLTVPRSPKYVRKSINRSNKLDHFAVILHPHTTETSIKKIESANTLVFICDTRANKNHIRDAVSRLYNVKVVRVNTLIRPDGQKKAFVKLSADVNALEVANKIGFI